MRTPGFNEEDKNIKGKKDTQKKKIYHAFLKPQG